MNCGICRHDNETGSKYCSDCGALLAPCCPSCGAEQPAGAKFCNQCGASMVAGVAPAPEAAPPVPAPTAAVRKSVTALFGDLVGSTSFGEQVDPEAARAALAPYFEILRSTIEDHAGTVAKFTGDGIMAIFGVPEVAEDDALRAVAAGLEIQRRFRAFAESVRDRHGVELGMRVGINTGELVISDADEDLVGDVLNTAARLEASCQPGRVTVGEDTWRLTRSSITYEVLGEVRVKGKADALATFQVVDTGLETVEENIPFVGREVELAEVRAGFDEAVASGSCRLVTVIGAPGVGKTRLASELRSGIEARSFDLRFERRGSTTFTPIVELLRELTGSGSPADVARLVGGHSEADRLAGVLSSFMGDGESRSTEESFWAVRRLLEHLATDEPVVVVVDDIQWAEPLFWDLLDHLAEWVSAPVMVLALARPELRELRPELTQPGRRVAASVALEGLDADTTRELAARLLDTDELPADLIERIPDSTEGNPLFVRELVQMLVDDGVLARTGDRWHLTIDVDAIEVPPTILSLLASRVERLPDDERQVVELASVIGTEFDRGVLGSIAGDDVTARLGALIDRLRRKDLVEPSGTWAGDHPVYRFHHVLVRDAAYRRLLKGHRADLHERVGRYLEGQGASGDQADVVIAHHYEQVHRYRSELGTVDEPTRALAGHATRRLRTAAEQALAREDLASAGGYTIRALGLAGDSDERDELLVLGCEALLSSGDVARGAPLVDELLARDLDERLAAWADCFRAQLWSLTDSDRLSEASTLTADSADRLEALGDPAGVAKARLVRALILARLGRVGDCEAELDLALEAARAAGDRRRTVAVLGAAPLAALWGPSPVARAGGRCLDVLRLLRITTTSPAVEATSVRCQGMLEALRGRFDSARDKFELSRTTARDLGLRHGLYETELFEGLVELLAGNPAAAEPHLVLARDGLGALGIGADAGQAGALLARSVLQQNRVDEADRLAVDALASAGQNLQTAIASRSVLAEIRAVQGRHDEARQYADEAIEIAERTDVILDHALALQAAVRVARRAGDTEAAARFERAVQRLFGDKGVTMGDGETSADVGPSSPTDEPTAARPASRDDEPEGPAAASTPPIAPNTAWEVNERLWSTWIDDDRAGYLALLAPDFQAQIHELGPKLAFSGDRDATADVLFGALADDRAKAIPNRLVAVRGDDLALIAMVFQDGSSTSTMYTVSQVRDGRAVRADTFAEDQLGDAHDELDRRWVTLGAPAAEVGLLIELRRSSADGDYARFRELLADDFEAVGHGRVALLARRSTDEFIESLRPLFGDGGVAISVFADVPAITDGVALTRYHLDVADGSEWRVWYLWHWESGRLARADIYELEFYDAALARYDELSGDDLDDASAAINPEGGVAPPVWNPTSAVYQSRVPTTLTNVAAERAMDCAAAYNNWDADRIRSLLHTDFVSVNHETLALGFDRAARTTTDPDTFVGVIMEQVEYASDIATTCEVLAVRGEDLCLASFRTRFDEAETIRYVVVRTQINLVAEFAWFDDTQLAESQIELDRVWHDSLDFADSHPVRRLGATADSADPDDPSSFGPRPNVASDVLAQFLAAAASGQSAMAPLLHPDFSSEDRAPSIGVGSVERSGTLDGFAMFAEQGLQPSSELIATRGDSLCLARFRLEGDLGNSSFLLVVQVEGRLGRSAVRFGADQYTEAQLELDRLWFDELGFADDHPARHLDASCYATDGDEILATIHPDITWGEHRTLWHSMDGPGEFAAAVRALELIDHVIVPAMHRISEHGVVYERHEIGPAGEVTAHQQVVAFRDGLTVSIDNYDVDDLAAAMARYDELVAGDVWKVPVADSMRNRTVEILDAAARSWPDDLNASLADDFVFAGRRTSAPHFDAGADHLISAYQVWNELGLTKIPGELLAVRGDDLVLLRGGVSGDQGELAFLVVIQTGADRLVHSWTVFDPDQLTEAYGELDGRHLETLPIDPKAVPQARHWYATDQDDVAEFLHPRFRFRDHRNLAWPDADRDVMLEYVGTLPPGSYATVPEVFRVTDRDFVIRRVQFMEQGTSSTDSIVVGQCEDELLIQMDWYEPDDLDAALARYDELVARSSLEEEWNRAAAIAAWTISLVARDGFDAHRELFAPEFVHENRRLHPRPGHGDAEAVGELMTWLHERRSTDVDIETIAVRGGSLCLQRWRCAPDSSDEIEYLALTQLDADDRVAVSISYDPEQIVDAHLELDRRWLDELGLPADHIAWMKLGEAYETDPERAAATIHPKLEFVNHRRLGYESGGASALTNVLRSTHFEMVVTMPRVHRLSERGAVVERVETAVDEIGENRMIIVVGYEDGLSRHLEGFDVDDLDTALARYDELTATPDPTRQGPELTNDAWRIGEALAEAMEAGDRERLLSLTGDCFAAESQHRFSLGVVLDRTEWVDMVLAMRDAAADTTTDRTLLAVRGDSLCLQRVTARFDGDEIDRLSVLRVSDGCAQHMVWFEPDALHEALDELDRSWTASGGPATAIEISQRIRHEFDSGTPETFAECFSRDLVVIDHRQLGMGTRGYDEWISSAGPTVGHTDAISRDVRVHGSAVGLTSARGTFRPDGSTWDIDVVTTWDPQTGIIDRWEIFDVEDVNAARARYDELVSRADDRPSADAHVNSVWRRVLRFRDAWNAGDRDRCSDVLGDGATFEGRQQGHTGIVFGGEELLDLLFDQELYGDASSREFRLIASRGNDLCLCQIDENVDGNETRSLHLIDGGERGLRLFRYDLDQLAVATAELDRLHAQARPNAPTFSNAAWEGHLRFREAWIARDRETCRTILGDEFEVVPMHNLSTGQSFDAVELLGLIFDNDDLEIQPEHSANTLVAIRGDNLCLYRTEETAASGTGARYWLNDTAASRLYRLDETRLIEAQMMLDRLWFDSLGFAADHPIRTLSPTTYAVDPETVLAIAHPQIAYREHRRLSFEGGGRDQLAARTSSLPLVDHVIVPVIHRISDAAALFHKDEINANGDTSSMLVVSTLRDRLVGSYDIYDSNDLDAATARYDELAIT